MDAPGIARRKAFPELGEADVRLLTDLRQCIHGAERRFVSELWCLPYRDPRKFVDAHSALQKIVLYGRGLAIDTSQGAGP